MVWNCTDLQFQFCIPVAKVRCEPELVKSVLLLGYVPENIDNSANHWRCPWCIPKRPMSAIPNDRPALKRQPVQETLLKVVGWCILSEQSGFKCCLNVQVLTSLFFMPRFLLMMGVLFCCGAGFFIRRRMYPPPLVEEPTFNVSYTRQPVNTASGQRLLIPVPLLPYFGQGT